MAKSKIIPGFPALMIEDDKKSLVITDLHLGFESNLSLNNVILFIISGKLGLPL